MTKLQLGLKTKKGPSVVCTDKSNAFKLRTERDREKEKERKKERERERERQLSLFTHKSLRVNRIIGGILFPMCICE